MILAIWVVYQFYTQGFKMITSDIKNKNVEKVFIHVVIWWGSPFIVFRVMYQMYLGFWK